MKNLVELIDRVTPSRTKKVRISIQIDTDYDHNSLQNFYKEYRPTTKGETVKILKSINARMQQSILDAVRVYLTVEMTDFHESDSSLADSKLNGKKGFWLQKEVFTYTHR
ncbi:hypothetical protein JZU46_06535 [bacterium]|jgi:hypothetical protein|nr:hypothetical protein [bacterium]